MAESISPELFTRDCCGTPCRFALLIHEKELESKLKELIREGGGTTEDHKRPDSCDCRLLIVDPDAIYNKDDGDAFSAKYILDCAEAKKLIGDLSSYRVNKRSNFEEYNPIDILMGKRKWSDLSRTLSAKIRSPRKELVEEEVSDIDDDAVIHAPVRKVSTTSTRSSNIFATAPGKDAPLKDTPENNVTEDKAPPPVLNESKSSSSDFRSKTSKRIKPTEAIKAAVKESALARENNKKVSAWLAKSQKSVNSSKYSQHSLTLSSAKNLTGVRRDREPYTRKEEESILMDIVEYQAYNMLKGNQYWIDCERRAVACKGRRTWQSMKERFRKKVVPSIHITFRHMLDQKALDNFEKFMRGIPVEEETSDSEASEREDEDNENDVTPDILENPVENNLAQSTPVEESSKPKKRKKKGISQADAEILSQIFEPNVILHTPEGDNEQEETSLRSSQRLRNSSDKIDNSKTGRRTKKSTSKKAAIEKPGKDSAPETIEATSEGSSDEVVFKKPAIPGSSNNQADPTNNEPKNDGNEMPQARERSKSRHSSGSSFVLNTEVNFTSKPVDAFDVIDDEQLEETATKPTIPKRKRKLWTDKQYSRVSNSFESETPSVAVKAMAKAKSDYLQIENPVPSTSKQKVPDPVLKKPIYANAQFNDESDIETASTISNSTHHSTRGNPYSRNEEQKIIEWIVEHKRFSEVKGIAMWKILEFSGILPGRSHQSIKERFRKHILPNINHYAMDESDREAFKLQRNSKPLKRILPKAKNQKRK